MKRRIFIVIILLFGLLFVANTYAASEVPGVGVAKVNSGGEKIIDRIVVFVNKNVITSNQVEAAIQQTLYNLKEKNIPVTNSADLRHQVTEQLIVQSIQLDIANNNGIKTTESETTDAITGILKQQKITLEQLQAKLAGSGISYANFKQQVQDQITVDKLKQREVGGRVSVSENEVNRILSSELFKHKVEYELSDIVISLPMNPSEAIINEKRNLANLAYQSLQSGQKFASVVVKYSDAANALSGGKLGFKSNLSLPPMIVKELENTQVGAYTNVIQLPMGFFIFKLDGIRKYGEAQMVRQYHVRHILIKVNQTRTDEEAHAKIIEIQKSLEQDKNNPEKLNLDFIKYAKEYSEDTSSINGGDLNWVSLGDTVPTFESAVIHTKVGVISPPIKTPFGWHLLEVLGIRESNLATDKEKSEIRQELRMTKANLVYEQWLRDIRSAAYVKFNQD